MKFSQPLIPVELSCFILTLFFILPSGITAQWTGNIHTNKLLVTECKNPININTVSDLDGGGFIVWEDKIDSGKGTVFFQHFNNDGILNFRTDGKPVSSSRNEQILPSAAQLLKNNAVVLWKEKIQKGTSELFVQSIKDNGQLLWGEYGIQITKRMGEEKDPSLTTDTDGNVFVCYSYEDYNLPGNYGVYLQKLSSNGFLSFKENGMLIYRSTKMKIHPTVKADEKGGCYIFWLESNEGKNYLYALHIDSEGQLDWGKKPILISALLKDVFSYNVESVLGAFAYMVWEVNSSDKDIFHQLISRTGKIVWKKGGEIVTTLPGNQTYPRAVFSDSTITVTWINEIKNDKDIYIQKFTVRGKPLWNKDGIPLIKSKGNQIGQSIINDKKSGAVIVWFDRPTADKNSSAKEKLSNIRIMAQRVDKNGNKLWDSTGILVAANPGSEKSYLSLLSDKADGAIALFKDKRANKYSIYGQKILSSGRYVFELLSFNSLLEKDFVKLNWQTRNEQNNKGFYIERSTSDTNWQKIKFIPGQNMEGICSYEFDDRPAMNGVNYYRLVQIDNDNVQQQSAAIQVNYLSAAADNYALMQNLPNPFSDSTYIRYYLPEDSDVEVEVFDDKIETISQIVNSFQSKGEHSVVFYNRTENGRLPNGIYYYRLKAVPADGSTESFVDVKKMVISR